MNAKCDPNSAQLVDFLVANLRTTACLAGDVPPRQPASGLASFAARNASRRRFSPSLAYGRHFCPPLPTARRAAVMILFERRGDGWSIPLTVRPHHLPDHPGQVCLPGGRLEPGETVTEAAEREFCEELGLEQFPAHTLGQLQSIYVFNSDFYLTPCLAAVEHELEYEPSVEEVESVIHLPVEYLLDLERHVIRAHARGAVSWTALGIEYEGIHIWGATAIVLGELAAILSAVT
jgi:8-oxo-dGTP pyrophosphatase MutT (NUDIX family)